MWDAICEMCGGKIKVPFKPDPKRSTYCKDCLVEARKQTAESVGSNKASNKDFGKEEEKKEVTKVKDKEIKTVDSRNNFVGQGTDTKEERSFSVSDNFLARKTKDKPEIMSDVESKILEDKDHKDKAKENDTNLQKENRPQKRSSDVIIEDDSSQKNINAKKINQSIPKNLSEDKNLEIKEGEVVKF